MHECFVPKMMDFFGLGTFWLEEGTPLAVGYQGGILSSGRMLCVMNIVGRWQGALDVSAKHHHT